LVCLPANESLPRQFRELLARRELEWPPAIEVNSLELIEIYVSNGFGIGLSFFLPGTRRLPNVRSIPIAEMPPLTIGALWRGKATPLVEALLEALRGRARLFSGIKP
jgi:DNA-binding transcriptional LysR family regulator